MFALWYIYLGWEEYRRVQGLQWNLPNLQRLAPKQRQSSPQPTNQTNGKQSTPKASPPSTPTVKQTKPNPPSPIVDKPSPPKVTPSPSPPRPPVPTNTPTTPRPPPPPVQPPTSPQQPIPQNRNIFEPDPQLSPESRIFQSTKINDDPPSKISPIMLDSPQPPKPPTNNFPNPSKFAAAPDFQPLTKTPPKQEEKFNNFGRQSSKQNTPKMVDAAVLEKLETGFKKLQESDSKSLLKKYLTQEVFDSLKTKKTPTFGSTLLDVIQSGLENHDSGVGIYAPDAEAYGVFADLFDPIIEDYHGGFKKTDKHPPRDFGDVDSFANLDPAGEYIISTRVRCGRSMQGYPFNPCLTEAQYKEMEEKVSSTLSGLSGELKGDFYPLTGMTKEVQQKLIDDHFLFKEGDRFLQAANACRFWPTGRGIYHNDNKTFLVWCNEEDHLRIISMQMGGDLGQVYRRLVSAVNDIEKRIPFSHDDRLGFLTFCPTNLGTTIRASVHIKVPKLAANKAKLEEVAGKFNLQVRGTRGEHTEAEGGVYDISNKRRMGLTEYQAVKEMNDGIAELIKIEREL
ncbi:arginine kinase isoform X1 [Nilaparvata lugens]|nr:arginine kinase isoform X1 [Nilaparvata lugens]